VLNEYHIVNKIFHVTLDIASGNKNYMDKLKHVLRECLGFNMFLQ
jgi:hypothetical protein